MNTYCPEILLSVYCCLIQYFLSGYVMLNALQTAAKDFDAK
jgi:hypothetical protein